MAALVMMFVLVVNVGLLIRSRMAFDRAVEHAALAALSSSVPGETVLDVGAAKERARNTLRVELGNVEGLREAPASVATDASVVITNPDGLGCAWSGATCYQGALVQARASATICGPLLPCIAVSGTSMASLSADVVAAPAATPIPPQQFALPSPTL